MASESASGSGLRRSRRRARDRLHVITGIDTESLQKIPPGSAGLFLAPPYGRNFLNLKCAIRTFETKSVSVGLALALRLRLQKKSLQKVVNVLPDLPQTERGILFVIRQLKQPINRLKRPLCQIHRGSHAPHYHPHSSPDTPPTFFVPTHGSPKTVFAFEWVRER